MYINYVIVCRELETIGTGSGRQGPINDYSSRGASTWDNSQSNPRTPPPTIGNQNIPRMSGETVIPAGGLPILVPARQPATNPPTMQSKPLQMPNQPQLPLRQQLQQRLRQNAMRKRLQQICEPKK